MDVKVNGLDNLERLGREFPKASARALNKTAKHVRTQMAKDARERYKVKSADIKKSMGPLQSASAKKLKAIFSAKGKRLALTYFMTASNIAKSLEQAGKKIRRRTPVTFQITKGQKQRIPHSFVAKMKSGHMGVFKRTNTTALPIQEKTGPATSQMLSGAFTRMKGVYEFMSKTVAHEVEWLLKGKNGGSNG